MVHFEDIFTRFHLYLTLQNNKTTYYFLFEIFNLSQIIYFCFDSIHHYLFALDEEWETIQLIIFISFNNSTQLVVELFQFVLGTDLKNLFWPETNTKKPNLPTLTTVTV